VGCPWCYLGKRRLEGALSQFEHADDVEVVFHSFQLDPSAPTEPTETATQMLARRYGMSPQEAAQAQGQVIALAEAEGMHWEHERSLHLNTRAAHRLLQLALAEGGPARQAALEEALFDAYFAKAENVAGHAELRRLALAAGLDAERVDAVLAQGESSEFEARVEADVRQAAAYGATGVPFFVLDGRFGISGAQPTELFAQALRQAWDTRDTK